MSEWLNTMVEIPRYAELSGVMCAFYVLYFSLNRHFRKPR